MASSSLAELLGLAQARIAKGVALPEAEVLVLARRILAAAAREVEAGTVTVEVLKVAETLLKLKVLIGKRSAR